MGAGDPNSGSYGLIDPAFYQLRYIPKSVPLLFTTAVGSLVMSSSLPVSA